MTDTFTPAERSEIMRRVRGVDTNPEVRARCILHAAGFRYRLHVAALPGKPDIVLPRFRLAVFIHGCFWHWHGCKRSRMPAANRAYWEKKIARNVARDKRHAKDLRAAGWRRRVIWECALERGMARLLLELNRERAGASHHPT
jgi:DNA mismatch endonuclease (patch repair protein)